MLTEFVVFEVTVFVDALYDALNQEDWWDQEVTHISITLTVLRASRRRPTELFTVCDNFLTFLLPRRLHYLHVITENQRNMIHYRRSQWNIRTYSSETMLSYCHNASSPFFDIE